MHSLNASVMHTWLMQVKCEDEWFKVYGHDLNVCDTNSQRAHTSFFVTLFISRWCTDLVCWERRRLCQKRIYWPNHILEKVWFGIQHLNLGSCKFKLDLCILSLNCCDLFENWNMQHEWVFSSWERICSFDYNYQPNIINLVFFLWLKYF